MIIVAILAATALQITATEPRPMSATPDIRSQEVKMDSTGAPQLTEEQRREVVCPHRPPTGSRLARSWCERRARAEARAQAAREAHEDRVLGSGWQSPDIPGAGPL